MEILTSARVVLNFRSYSKVSIHLWICYNLQTHVQYLTYLRAFPVNDNDAHSSPLRFILGECGICVIGFEVLDLFEMRALLVGTHHAGLGQLMPKVGI